MRNFRTISTLMLALCTSASVQASSLYVLGQAGGFNSEHSGGSAIFTGRLGGGYERDFSINVRENEADHLFFCFDYGVEIAYQGYQEKTQADTISLGSYTYTRDTRFERDTIDLLAVLDYHLISAFDLFFKFGPGFVFRKSAEHYVSSNVVFERERNNCKVVPKLMFGIGYDVTHRININLAFTNEFETNAVKSAKSLMGGLKFRIT